MKTVLINNIKPFVSSKTWEWCQLPYPGHKYGCPNYGKKPGCPPTTTLLPPDRSYKLYIYRFPLIEHMAAMWRRHPGWSERQARCCLYWQPRARKNFRKLVEFAQERGFVIWNPEAHGVDLTSLCHSLGIRIDWPPKDDVTMLALERKS